MACAKLKPDLIVSTSAGDCYWQFCKRTMGGKLVEDLRGFEAMFSGFGGEWF
jgi:hypothetical protein